VLIGDVTMAFPHAKVDQPFATALPMEVDGLVLLDVDDKEVVLKGGSPVIVLRAQYGYRKSPQLWQKWLVQQLCELGLVQLATECTGLRSADFLLWLIFHVDDFMFMGPRARVEQLVADMKERMKLREVSRLAKSGDEGIFLNRVWLIVRMLAFVCAGIFD
jgi:hypothetical protein